MKKLTFPLLMLGLIATIVCTRDSDAQVSKRGGSGGTSYSHPSAISLSNGLDSQDGGTFTGTLRSVGALTNYGTAVFATDGGASRPVSIQNDSNNNNLYLSSPAGTITGISFDDIGTLQYTNFSIFTLNAGMQFNGALTGITDVTATGKFQSSAASGNPGFKCYSAGCRVCLTDACTEYITSDGSGTLLFWSSSSVQSTKNFTTWQDIRSHVIENYQQRLTGTLSSNATAVGNVGVGEDDLITYSLGAGALTAANSLGAAVRLSLRVTAWGTGANNANAKTLKCYFGSTVVLTHSLPTSEAVRWRATFDVLQTGTDAQDYNALLVHNGSTTPTDVELGSATENQTNAITIKCTGEATANDDVKQEALIVEAL